MLNSLNTGYGSHNLLSVCRYRLATQHKYDTLKISNYILFLLRDYGRKESYSSCKETSCKEDHYSRRYKEGCYNNY